MIILKYTAENTIKVFISKAESINYSTAVTLIRKGIRMIQQNGANSVEVEFENIANIEKSALAFFSRVISNIRTIPVTIINL